MNPKYFHVSFGYKIGLPQGERLREEGLKASCDLEKLKTSVFEYLTKRPNLERRLKATL